MHDNIRASKAVKDSKSMVFVIPTVNRRNCGILALCRSLSRSASVKPHLETLDQSLRSFVDMANRNECFSDFSKQKTAKERWHSLVSRMGDREEYLETPSPSPRV